MAHILKKIVTGALLFVSLAATALDLPVRTINGRQYYYYEVRNRETVYGLSKRLGVTREEIVRYNPSMADGLKRGAILYFPVDEFSDRIPAADSLAYPEPEGSDSYISSMPDDMFAETDTADTATTSQADSTGVEIPAKGPLAVVCIPGGEFESKRAQMALDFYRGFLIDADTLAGRSGRVDVRVVDSHNPGAISQELLDSARVVIGPEDATALAALAGRCRDSHTYLLNLFVVADTLYTANPYVMQANIPAADMYDKACEALGSEFPGFVPVILRNTAARNEKDPFTACLKQHFSQKGLPYVEINYVDRLQTADLAELDTEPSRNYVFVPSSGTLAEFNKFAYVLKNFRDSRMIRNNADDTGTTGRRAEIFGYPDWIAFRGDAQMLLHQLDARIYSRFFDDYDNFSSRTIDSEFMHWFGKPMEESVPSQGLLGYDAGSYVLRNILSHSGGFDPLWQGAFRGIQSTFRFVRHPGGGLYNTGLYLIRFETDGRLSARTL